MPGGNFDFLDEPEHPQGLPSAAPSDIVSGLDQATILLELVSVVGQQAEMLEVGGTITITRNPPSLASVKGMYTVKVTTPSSPA